MSSITPLVYALEGWAIILTTVRGERLHFLGRNGEQEHFLPIFCPIIVRRQEALLSLNNTLEIMFLLPYVLHF